MRRTRAAMIGEQQPDECREAPLTARDAQLPLHVLKKFRLIYGSVRQHFHEVESSCGITGSQLWVLQEVSRQPGIGVSELAERLSIHQSTASQLLEKLAVQGLILKERRKEDQRRVDLALTRAAEKLLAHAPGPAEGLLPEALMALPDPVLKSLDSSLSEVIAQLSIRDERLADKPLADM